MTSHDPMPFGKYKGQPIADLPDDYVDWLLEQEWFAEKWKQLYKLLTDGDSAVSTPKERENILVGKTILSETSPAFQAWWKVSYGERMRQQGEMNYLGFLRVAWTAWQAGVECQREAAKGGMTKPLSQMLTTPLPVAAAKVPTLPPPLAHIPAPRLDSEPELDPPF